MPDQPLAYFVTFTTYGTWLHGRAPGFVDCAHNQFESELLPADPVQEHDERAAMSQAPYALDQPRRRVVLATIQEVCRHRGWRLVACHVRATHVHAVIAAEAAPEKVMNDFKAYASRRLTEAGFESRDRKRWTRHGSTKYIWDEAYLANAVHYVIEQQGEPMECYRESSDPPLKPPSEPRP